MLAPLLSSYSFIARRAFYASVRLQFGLAIVCREEVIKRENGERGVGEGGEGGEGAVGGEGEGGGKYRRSVRLLALYVM